MNKVVLDASVILAVIGSEPGAETVKRELLGRTVASTVNLAEVQTKLISRGWASNDAWEDAISWIREIAVFDEPQAQLVGDLVSNTKQLGLSLGDRACLALAMTRQIPVYTTEKTWSKLKIGPRIHVIR